MTDGMPRGQARIPFFHVLLKPGEGVVIPSMAYHRILSRTSRRVALNFFLEPRFGKTWRPGAPKNSYSWMDRDKLALRTLWLRTMNKFWDAERVSRGDWPLVMHTGAMEFM